MNHAFTYREFQVPAALASHIECGWLLRAPEGGQINVKRVFPDNCIDIYIQDECRPVVAGSAKKFRVCPVSPGALLTGLRVRAGAGGALLGVSAEGLLDCTLRLKDLLPNRVAHLEDKICRARNEPERIEALTRILLATRHNWSATDPLVTEAVRVSKDPKNGATVRQLCAHLAVSERHLRRRFRAAFGYGPKSFLRIARFQRLLLLMRRERFHRDWAGLALDAGYADQAHMINEVGTLAGVSPSKLGL
jgi:AraC-like DNA-binding protein